METLVVLGKQPPKKKNVLITKLLKTSSQWSSNSLVTGEFNVKCMRQF